jgi:ketosteroid isomerase-like protein
MFKVAITFTAVALRANASTRLLRRGTLAGERSVLRTPDIRIPTSGDTRMRSSTEASVQDTLVAQLRAAMNRWYNGDPSGYAALFADDVTYFAPVTAGRLEGIDALRALFAPVAGKINIPRFEMLNPLLQLHDNIGILTYNVYEYAHGDSATTRWNATEVYRRIGNDWRIIHGHWSPLAETQ